MSEALRMMVQSHSGEFLCSQIHEEKNAKIVKFRHVIGAPRSDFEIPNVPGLAEFYQAFGSLTLYLDDQSGESAFYVAEPSQWDVLKADFESWLDGMDEDEISECIPFSVEDSIAVGEIPRSGNYLLVPTSGPDAGKVYEFEHDGFEFIELGKSLCDFVERALAPNSRALTGMASHMRFIVGDWSCQWWIKEMRDNHGRVVKTKA